MNLYLSLLRPDRRNRLARADLASPYEMHRTLARGFGDNEGEYAGARCLFRQEEPPGRDVIVLVQSLAEPDWTLLAAIPGYLLAMPETRRFEPAFRAGDQLAFRLLANPTVKRDGKRLGILDEEGQLAWLKRKLEAGGGGLLGACSREEGMVRCKGQGDACTTLLSVRFDGRLVVTDPDLLIRTLAGGIGSAKGYGFGLLSVARA